MSGSTGLLGAEQQKKYRRSSIKADKKFNELIKVNY